MSHLSTVKMSMKSLDAIKEAAKRLGLVVTNQKSLHSSYVNISKCEGVLQKAGETIEGNKAAIVKDSKGEFSLQLDYWCNSLTSVIGNGAEKFTKSYTEVVTETEMTNAGYLMSEKTQDAKTGETIMVFNSMC